MQNNETLDKAREMLKAALAELEGAPCGSIRDELASESSTPFSVAFSALASANVEIAIAGLPEVAAYSEGRKAGLKEMYLAVSENFNVSQFANEETLKLMSEFPH